MMTEPAYLRITTPGGSTVHVRSGNNDHFWSRYENGSWEPETFAVFRRFIGPQDCYIDIGAWIGPTLLLGCQLAKRAYGIEPDPIAYAELSENIQHNRPLTDNVRLFNLCIAPVSGKISFGNRGSGGDSMSSLLFSSEATSWTVEGMNFEEWIKYNEIPDCRFIKIDIEGGEYRLLPTIGTYLRINRPTVLLSLHPCFLGDLDAQGLKAKLKRSLLRLKSTVQVLYLLRFYRYLYSPRGRCPACTYWHRTIEILDRAPWKPSTLFLSCLYGLLGRPHELLITDRRW